MQIQIQNLSDDWLPTPETFASVLTELTDARRRFPTHLKSLQMLSIAWGDLKHETECLTSLGTKRSVNEATADVLRSRSLAFYMSLVTLVVMAIRVMEEGDPDLPAYTPPTADELDTDG